MAVLHPIAVENLSSVLTDDEVVAALPALQHQANYHFRPYWDAGCSLHFAPDGAWPKGMWQLSILDDSDQAGALGYHDVTAEGLPLLKVFAATDKSYGLSWTVTTSHELLEALADPDCVRLVQVTDTELYALEVGDPVEADEFGYEITTAQGAKVLVSDFILPAWFHSGAQAIKYDYQHHVAVPLQLLKGGYQSIYVSGKGWTQVYQRTAEGAPADVTDKVPVEAVPGQRPRPSKDVRQLAAAGKL